MVDTRVPVLELHQYGMDSDEDRLFVFAAPAKDLASWAGVPRKAWRLRMLYQRWVKPARERELAEFWNRASRPNRGLGETCILGPTAITLALQDDVSVADGKIHLRYDSPLRVDADKRESLCQLAGLVLPRVRARLTQDQSAIVDDFLARPRMVTPEHAHDYVFEFAVQLAQMAADASWFVEENQIEEEDLTEMVVALEALCRPALVVDGQHRLLGAADSGTRRESTHVVLPVVALPKSNWVEQIYQFIVINEKAEKVEPSLLTDIFGSSLTRFEQVTLRNRFARARVDVEARIAAVVTGRDFASPFLDMVRFQFGPDGKYSKGFITDKTIRLLIDGATRHARGWRNDEEFFDELVRLTIAERQDWEAWTSGKWREYWFSFWRTVGEYYNEQARQVASGPLWTKEFQTNLTKAVTLRILQKLFIDKMIAEVTQLDGLRSVLEEALGAEAAEVHLKNKKQELAFPADVDDFPAYVTERFLKYIPVRVFLSTWVKSLDDDQGRQNLYDELERAFERVRKGQRYVLRGSGGVFAPSSAEPPSDD
ncbi:MAG: hypothetical protein HY791_12255 [Deltaproteobacteria bacterium]|nr:hypothetical protein [Deltaproteobacteria bacterium]